MKDDRPLTQFEALALLNGQEIPGWARPKGFDYSRVPEHLRPLAEATRRPIPSSLFGAWMAGLAEWYEMGATPEHSRAAVELAAERGVSWKTPQGLLWAMQEVMQSAPICPDCGGEMGDWHLKTCPARRAEQRGAEDD